jgi:inner membrane protein
MAILELFIGNPWFWFIFGAVLLVGELMLPGVFLMWLAAAAGLTGLVDLALGLNWKGEVVVFAALSLLMVLAFWKFVRAQHRPASDQPHLNQRHHAYVGRKAVLVQSIHNGVGKVNIDDTLWDVEGPELAAGTLVVVRGTHGMRLSVEAA